MVALSSFFIILTLSLLITRIATIAFIHTGLSRESARFQARSAFSGVGFTTTEAEQIVNHPVRRKIVMVLMLLGNAGIATVIASLILTFVHTGKAYLPWYYKLGVLFIGLLIIWLISSSKLIEKWLYTIIGWTLKKWTSLDVRDYASLLHLSGEYEVIELLVEKEDWLTEKPLNELALTEEGVLILGIQKSNGEYLGAPRPHTKFEPGDLIIAYGRNPILENLDQRRSGRNGDLAHKEAVEEQKVIFKEQEEIEIKTPQ